MVPEGDHAFLNLFLSERFQSVCLNFQIHKYYNPWYTFLPSPQTAKKLFRIEKISLFPGYTEQYSETQFIRIRNKIFIFYHSTDRIKIQWKTLLTIPFRFQVKKCLLKSGSPCIAPENTGRPNNPVAWNQNRDGIFTVGLPYGLKASGTVHRLCQLAVGARFSERNIL